MELQQRKARPENEDWWLELAFSGFIFKTHSRNTDSSQLLPPCKPSRRTRHIPTQAGLEIRMIIHPKSPVHPVPLWNGCWVHPLGANIHKWPSLADPGAPLSLGCGGQVGHTEGARVPPVLSWRGAEPQPGRERGWVIAPGALLGSQLISKLTTPALAGGRFCQILVLPAKQKPQEKKMLKEGFYSRKFSSIPLHLLNVPAPPHPPSLF